jgi:hypothetical protein
MVEKNASVWPEDLFDFGWFPDRPERLHELRLAADDEDWDYHNTKTDFSYPILFNYIRYTYRKLAEETKISLSLDGQFACFNTGLVTPNQEPLFASFEANKNENSQPWFFKGWFRRGNGSLVSSIH